MMLKLRKISGGTYRMQDVITGLQFGDGSSVAAGTGATAALDNIASCAINTSLISDAANTDDLGSSSLPWKRVYFGTSLIFIGASKKSTISVTEPASDRTITMGDPGGNDSVAYLAATQTLTNKTISGASNTLSVRGNDLAIASQAQGDILYYNGTSWVRLAAGSAGQGLVTAGAAANPYWGSPAIALASSLANSVTCEAGASDYTLAFGTAGGAYTLTIPAVGGSRTFAFINEAQVWTANQTFSQTGLLLRGGDTNTLNIKVNETLTGAKTLNVKVNDTDRTIDLTGNLTLAANLTTTTGAITLAGQAGGSSVTVPASGTLATLAVAEVLENKTLEATCKLVDTADNTKVVEWDASGATANKKTTLTFAHSDNRVITFPNATCTLVGKDTTDTFTNKTLTDTTCIFGANGALTKTAGFDLSGATADKKLTLISSHSDNRSITFPNATDTLVGKATADVLTNKTLDCDGTGNVVSNVNASELDPITFGSAAFGIPFIITYNLTNQAAAVNVFNANAPFKFEVIKAWSVATSADGGTWKLNNGAGGAGTDITNAVTVATSDQDFDEPTDYDDSATTIAQNGSLSVVPDGGGLLDCKLYIMAIRID